jgi:hypothetical protein
MGSLVRIKEQNRWLTRPMVAPTAAARLKSNQKLCEVLRDIALRAETVSMLMTSVRFGPQLLEVTYTCQRSHEI